METDGHLLPPSLPRDRKGGAKLFPTMDSWCANYYRIKVSDSMHRVLTQALNHVSYNVF